ncbi:predicted transcriptional regulators [Gluconobacter frateurii NBRC 103465]|nr:predicted transcriptional regulators [Gluconobacter frateurii NBRC 103465]
MRGRGAAMTYLSHKASFHSRENTTPSNHGTKHNILRLIFLDPRSRTLHPDWENAARFIVSSFKIDTARARATEAVEPLVAELCAASSEFRALLQDRTVHTFGHGAKTFHHPVHGPQTFEVSTFAVDGRPDLILVIYGDVS